MMINNEFENMTSYSEAQVIGHNALPQLLLENAKNGGSPSESIWRHLDNRSVEGEVL